MRLIYLPKGEGKIGTNSHTHLYYKGRKLYYRNYLTFFHVISYLPERQYRLQSLCHSHKTEFRGRISKGTAWKIGGDTVTSRFDVIFRLVLRVRKTPVYHWEMGTHLFLCRFQDLCQSLWKSSQALDGIHLPAWAQDMRSTSWDGI